MARGKHAAPRQRRRPTLGALTAVLALTALGSSAVLHSVQSTPATAGQAKIVSAGQTPNASAPALDRLVVYGHSMPAGRGATDPSRGYAALAAELTGLTLVNHADGGTLAAAAARSMAASAPLGPSDAVVIHTGMNDILRRGGKAVAPGRQQVARLLAASADAGRRVVVLECQPASWRATPGHRDLQDVYESWNRMVREQVDQHPGVAVLAACADWDAQRFTDASAFHPNDAGHALIAEQLARLLTAS